jgi:ergothioneine biosynthesis protein EgtB
MTSSLLDVMTPSLLDRFSSVRALTRELADDLAPEDQVVQSMEDVSPTKWHLAHTTWFWETFILQPHAAGYRLHNEHYPYLFNSYYMQAGERHCRAQRGYLSRPTVSEVLAYRADVDEAMSRFLENEDFSPELRYLVHLGLNHEQQHQELVLTDLKHVFAVNPLRPAYRPPGSRTPSDAAASAAPLRWIDHPGGLHSIGWAGAGFAYDNEGPRHRRFIEPFSLADRLVTNGEFLEFMADGGYDRPELWMSEGWAARQEHQWSEPFYWERRDGAWWMFTLHGMRPVAASEPVCHVSWYEADAYARWAGARLPREEEWEVFAREQPIRGNLLDARAFHPRTAPPAGGSEPAPRQLWGDVWEWTSSPYSPYPGYRPEAGAVGEYNGKFMVNQFVLRGGSCATSADHLRPTYRNFFHPDASWQFSGIRLARDPERPDTPGS